VGEVTLHGVRVTPLKRISTLGGDVMHAMKRSDEGYADFGEAYFSWIEPGAVKAWKRHKRMTLNLVVPMGSVNFVFHLPRDIARFRSEVIGDQRYARLTVPPGIWFGIQGLGSTSGLILNLADIPHDPEEVERRDLTEIYYDWRAS
jgi:dTDP-4-dehydrorhamnose 3,5-epimerase